MASTPLLGLSLPADGTTNWGTLVNASITALLDSAVAGTTTLSSDADVTLTTTTEATNQARQAVLLCTGSRAALRTITAPAQSKTYVIINATTGGFGVKIVGVGPTTGVTIPNGRAYMVAWNGSDFVITGVTTVNLATDVTGTLPIANGGTNSTSTPTAGSVAYGTGGTYAFTAVGTPGQVLTSNAGAAPTWSSLTANVSSISFGSIGLTPSTATSGAVTVGGTLGVSNGGTGVTTSTGTGSVVLNNAPTLTTPKFVDQGYISDTVGNRVLNFTTNSASTNYINITATVTGSSPVVSAAGSSTNISLQLSAKGSGKVRTNVDLLIGGFVTAGNGIGSFSTNTVFGESGLSSNVSGEYITAMGTNAASSVTTAQYLTAFGNGAAQTVTTSNRHSAFGYRALYSMSNVADAGDIWNGCTAVGFRALQNNIGDAGVSDSVGVGSGALYSSTSGTLNVALGNGAMYSATTAGRGVAVGYKALYAFNNLDGVGIGYNAATAMVNSPITAVGSSAAESATASGITAIGYRALRLSTTGSEITAVGSGALQACVAGCNGNTALGYSAGSNQTYGTYNTYIGASTQPSTASSNSYEVVLGAGLTGKGSNTAYIGGTNGAYNGKNVTTWETTSDQRIKRNIVDSTKGLAEINRLQVRSFQYKEESDMPKTADGKPAVIGLDPNKNVTGFIAQEIQQVFPEAVNKQAHDILSVSADPVIYALVKAVQELTARLEALEAK